MESYTKNHDVYCMFLSTMLVNCHVAWPHQAITYTGTDFLSIRFVGITKCGPNNTIFTSSKCLVLFGPYFVGIVKALGQLYSWLWYCFHLTSWWSWTVFNGCKGQCIYHRLAVGDLRRKLFSVQYFQIDETFSCFCGTPGKTYLWTWQSYTSCLFL